MLNEPKQNQVPKQEGSSSIVFSKGNENLGSFSMPSGIGFNMSEFAIAPAGNLVEFPHQSFRYEWTHQKGDTEHEFYFQRTYRDIVPTRKTDDFLCALAHFSAKHEGDNPYTFPVSFDGISRLFGARYDSGKSQKQQYVHHLEALMGLRIATNYTFDTKRKTWNDDVVTSVISGYSYMRGDKLYKRRVPRNREGFTIAAPVRFETVERLKSVTWSPLYYKYFVEDEIPFDFAIYVALSKQISKRIYRYGNKYAQTFGDYEMDLREFCVSRIGMSPHRPDSELASKIRPHAKRVSETVEGVSVEVARSNTPSGYKISFKSIEPKSRKATASTIGFTKAEKKVYDLLVKNRIFSNAAPGVVIDYRTRYGKEGPAYIKAVVAEFNRKYKTGLRAPKGGVLMGILKKHLLDYIYIETRAKEEKKQWEDTFPRTGELSIGAALINRPPEGKPQTPKPSTFSLEQFKHDYPKKYHLIESAIETKYEQDPIVKKGYTEKELNKIKSNALQAHCLQTAQHFGKGNTGFFPELLIEYIDPSVKNSAS